MTAQVGGTVHALTTIPTTFPSKCEKNLSSDGWCKINLQLGIGKTIVRFDSHLICMHTAAKFYLSFVRFKF